jgi:AGZA family xanthine/uracil permease-like MFS transporter
MKPYGWARWGDVNAFFGLTLDNLTQMVMLLALISLPLESQPAGQYFFTPQFVLTRMIPGTALGVLFGDLVFTWMAFRLARRTGRSDVTAMPLGLDTPSTIAISLLILLPTLGEEAKRLRDALPAGESFTAAHHEEAMYFAWHVGLTLLVIVGLFKIALSPLGNAVRRWVPRAGLLGSLAAIALTLIAFLPLLDDLVAVPVVGMVALTVILLTLVARRRLPGNIPGALAAVLVGVLVYAVCARLGLAPPLKGSGEGRDLWQLPALWPTLPEGAVGWAWFERVLKTSIEKLPIALPFALATIVGGIDCVESAAAVGDEYDTRTVLLTEGIAATLAGLLGGVIQTTPYIGHPAYKAMGGRAAYTLATALFIGLAGCFGWFGVLFDWLPKPALFGIVVFVGLEITAQSYHATPTRHYAALALATMPALACLGAILIKRTLLPVIGPEELGKQTGLIVLWCLANGFIVTSLLWGSALAAMLDGRLRLSAAYLSVAGLCALFGIIHSPFPDERIALPHQVAEYLATHFTVTQADATTVTISSDLSVLCQSPYHWAAAYLLSAALLVGLSFFPTAKKEGEGGPQTA